MSLPLPHILCVDDDNDWCDLLKLMLEQSGDEYKMTAVNSVRQALVLIENLPFDLYLLDYGLPDATGTELCRQIRQKDSDTPILFYSAMAREIDRRMAIEAGATEYLVKPNDLERLTGTINRLLNDSCQSNPCGYGADYLQRSEARKSENSPESESNYDCLY